MDADPDEDPFLGYWKGSFRRFASGLKNERSSSNGSVGIAPEGEHRPGTAVYATTDRAAKKKARGGGPRATIAGAIACSGDDAEYYGKKKGGKKKNGDEKESLLTNDQVANMMEANVNPLPADKDMKEHHFRRCSLCLIGIVVISVLVTIVLVVTRATAGRRSDRRTPPVTHKMRLLHQQRLEELFGDYSPHAKFTGVPTKKSRPEDHAIYWLESDYYMNGYTDEQLAQRYALATFYYSTSGPDWEQREESERRKRWLDYTATECKWWYIQCDEDGLVVELVMRDYIEIGLKGTLPREVFLMSNLEQFVIRRDSLLVGVIPTEVGLLTSLFNLEFADTSLEGSIPTEISILTNLNDLVLPNNYLTGTVPTELGLLTGLEVLNVNDNYLKGTLPTELGALTNLGYFLLEYNELSGTVPTDYGTLSMLTIVNLDENKLTGSIPQELCHAFRPIIITSQVGDDVTC